MWGEGEGVGVGEGEVTTPNATSETTASTNRCKKAVRISGEWLNWSAPPSAIRLIPGVEETRTDVPLQSFLNYSADARDN